MRWPAGCQQSQRKSSKAVLRWPMLNEIRLDTAPQRARILLRNSLRHCSAMRVPLQKSVNIAVPRSMPPPLGNWRSQRCSMTR